MLARIYQRENNSNQFLSVCRRVAVNPRLSQADRDSFQAEIQPSQDH